MYCSVAISNHLVDEHEAKDLDIRRMSSSRRHSEDLPYVHKVGVPPKQDLLKEFTDTVKETFFADDPLRPFKDQPRSRQFVLGLQSVFPILEWRKGLQPYQTLEVISLPDSPLQASVFLRILDMQSLQILLLNMVYLKNIAIGPVAVVSLLVGTMLQDVIDPTENEVEYRRLAFTATFFAGITQATLVWEHSTSWGKELWTHFCFFSILDEWNWETIVIGLSFLAFLLLAKYIGKKNKKLFWVPAIAPLISVILSTFFVYITHAEKHGVQIVPHIRKGVNPPSLHEIYFTGVYVIKGFKIGVVVGLIALTEAIAIGRTFAAMKGYQLDGNKEMVALGTMNIVGSMTSCYVATGSFSRSAVNNMAGCRTAVSNIVMSCIVFANFGRLLIAVRKQDFVSTSSFDLHISVTEIDTSGIHALEELYKNLQKREVQLNLANPGQVVIDKLHASNFANLIGQDKIFLSVADAVLSYAPKMEDL
ncbi:Sulfate transporter 1.3 [Vitis vinifera]|uniref:Sulfate transporter 1.3 n=1 Tax=Vitis vinifera TaxID=29760 RepID=A0A438CLZ6_VITVI|nr:Sulfate transporter 1.3 [Vitis vinifera]